MFIIGEDMNISGIFGDPETGEEMFRLENINNVSLKSESRYEYNQKYQTNNLKRTNSTTMSVDIDKNINIEALLGIDLSKTPDMYDIQYMKYVQKRKHKKKRINKKWLKKYGVKIIPVTFRGWKLNTYANGEFEFVKSSLG